MILKHLNLDYRVDEPLLPFIVGDRRYGQDIIRDFYSTISHIGAAFEGLVGSNTFLLDGGAITANIPSGALDIAEFWAIIYSQVEIIQDFSAVPPPKQTVAISVPVKSAAKTGVSISGAVLDGSTTNYIKAAYTTTDVNTRDRVKRAGSYAFEVQPEVTITVDSTAPTQYELQLATFTGTSISTLTIVQTIYRIPSISAVTGNFSGAVSIGGDTTVGGALTAASIDTGQGAIEVGQNLRTTDAVTFATVDTGQGANELYDMNQNVTTTSNVTFNTVTKSSLGARDVGQSGTVTAGNSTVITATGPLLITMIFDPGDTGGLQFRRDTGAWVNVLGVFISDTNTWELGSEFNSDGTNYRIITFGGSGGSIEFVAYSLSP